MYWLSGSKTPNYLTKAVDIYAYWCFPSHTVTTFRPLFFFVLFLTGGKKVWFDAAETMSDYTETVKVMFFDTTSFTVEFTLCELVAHVDEGGIINI